MRLEIGDNLYINPLLITDKESYVFDSIKITKEQLLNTKFKVIKTRTKTGSHGDDICIKWVDGLEWWWGQINESQPWTMMFISERDYLRDKKLEQIL